MSTPTTPTTSNPTATKPPPLLVRALKAVGASDLSSGEKAVLRAMLQWWNPRTGELWPSIASIAQSAGFTCRGVQKIIRRLESRGVVRLKAASAGGSGPRRAGQTNRFVLLLGNLPPGRAGERSASPEPGSGGLQPTAVDSNRQTPPPQSTDFEPPLPERSSPTPRTEFAGHPERRSAEPSKHEDSKGNLHPRSADRGDNFVRSGCLDAKTCAPKPEGAEGLEGVRELMGVLLEAGVRGPILRALAVHPGLSVPVVRREVNQVRRDRTARNVPAVLVARLSALVGLALPTRPRLDSASLAAVAKIEALRRARRMPRERAEPVADILEEQDLQDSF